MPTRLGRALLAAANGTGHRPIADRLGIPADTVRGWLRAARDNSRWLYKTAVTALHQAVRDDPALPAPNRSALWYAVDALGAAAAKIRRLFGTAIRTTAWPLIVLITGGRLLRPLAGSFRLNPRHRQLVKSVFFTTAPAALAAVARR